MNLQIATWLTSLCLLVLGAGKLQADEPAGDAASNTPKEAAFRSASKLVAKVRPSIVTIRVAGRDGVMQSMGAGFVVSADGLIVTNYHVLGESRSVSVELAHGRKLEVEEVFASDRQLDLAIIRVRLKNEQLPALELGDSQTLPQGEAIAAIGNPLGLQHSVVTGVVSALREIEGRKMIQLAMPIQPGNSGGPVLDSDGRVQGVVTMMSRESANIGFAIPINDVKPLLQKPNPIPMSRWLTIDAIDSKRWTTLFGAEWRQRGGRILVSGTGPGFGGRSLCLAQAEPPPRPFEMAVSVKMNDESGAAGLVFHSDGGDTHYGFYPSSGRLRLSRFEGPDVQSWTVLREVASQHYRASDWNDLRVQIADSKIRCFLNGHLVIESTDIKLVAGKVGLAKFRHTEAEFRRFQVSNKLTDVGPESLISATKNSFEQLPSLSDLLVEDVHDADWEAKTAKDRLNEHARELERRASELRKIANDVHTETITRNLIQMMEAEPGTFDLLRASLMVACIDEDVDVDTYIDQVDRMAREIQQQLPAEANDTVKLEALNKYLFAENGFHGSRFDYDHRANSYLSRVIDDREGLPITLSVLYIEMAERLGLQVVGIGLPGHFVVRWDRDADSQQLIDVFDAGKFITREDAARIVKDVTGQNLQDEHLAAPSHEDIIVRMVRNLIGAAERQNDKETMLRYYHLVVMLRPESVPDRGLRAVLRSETGRRAAAIRDLDWILEKQPPGIDLERIRQMRQFFEERKN